MKKDSRIYIAGHRALSDQLFIAVSSRAATPI